METGFIDERSLPSPRVVVLVGPGRTIWPRVAQLAGLAGLADQIGRFRELAGAGAAEVMLSLPGLDDDPTPLDTMAKVIAAFR